MSLKSILIILLFVLALTVELCVASETGATHFIRMPIDEKTAVSDAENAIDWLPSQGERLIIAEPAPGIDYEKMANGDYDRALEIFYSTLTESGFADSENDTWVYLPEENSEHWDDGHQDPALFISAYNRQIALHKRFMNKSKLGHLLDAKSDNAGDWCHVSLMPYLKGIDARNVSVFIYQGSPWASPADTEWDSEFDAAVFLDEKICVEAVNYLGVKKLIINTDTMNAAYAGDAKKRRAVSDKERGDMLRGIARVVEKIKKGLPRVSVFVILFSENKSMTEEGIDWSYRSDNDCRNLRVFSNDMKKIGVPLALFDPRSESTKCLE